MDYSRSLDRISKFITDKIEEELYRVGIFNRTFYRCKTTSSIKSKIAVKKYDGCVSYLRDAIGIRVNLYFADDLEIVYPFFRDYFKLVEETIDKNEETEFKPTRVNFVFRIPEQFNKEFSDIVNDPLIDNTFELQIRTILSEGWHEVDHDMRYKRKSDWDNNQDLGRMFNGVLASLEASSWTMIQIFENLSYRHYKQGNTESMLRAKFRTRLDQNGLAVGLEQVLGTDTNLYRAIFKIERDVVLKKLFETKIRMPLNVNNLIFMLNFFYLFNKTITELTPESLLMEFRNSYYVAEGIAIE